MQLQDVNNAYVRHLRVRAKAYSRSNTEVRLRLFERHFGATFDVAAMTTEDVLGFITARQEAGRAVSTINSELTDLRAAIKNAVTAGLLPELPCQITLLKAVRRRVEVLTQNEVLRLIGAAEMPYSLMLLIAAKTGLRHQEILHLQHADCAMAGPEPELRVTAKRCWTPKTYEERAIPLDPKGILHAALGQHLARTKKTPGDWIFGGLEGCPMRAADGGVRAAYRKAGLYAQLRRPGLHCLRRTWATELLGVTDIETVRELGGWSDLKTVQRYITTTPDRKRDAIAALG